MAGTLDYLRWRGDLTFNRDHFNSVDASLFASFSYLPFDRSVIGHTLGEICKQLLKITDETRAITGLERTEALLIPQSPRYKNVKVLDWVSELEDDPEPIQFDAGVFRIDDNTIVVAFRGTDDTMTGWSEDMVMNYTPVITGQKLAAKYLETVGDIFPDDKIFVTGHSKGGNYAHYAIANVNSDLQSRIIRSYSFDGPGYRHQIYGTDAFQNAMSKMKTYLPENSIIGAMLDHPERTLIVKCTRPMLDQHDPRKWSVGRNSFVLAKGLSTAARVVRHSLIHFNHTIPAKKREQMWSALFDAFGNLDVTSVHQISGIPGTYKFGRAYLALDSEMRSVFRAIFSSIISTASHNINLPFTSNEDPYKDYPQSNDSDKAPIFFEAYDITQE